MKSGRTFLDRLVERLDKLDPSSLQTYVLRLARQKGFLETVFNTIQEGVIVIDTALTIRYLNTAARNLLNVQDDGINQSINDYLQDVDWSLILDADTEEWNRISRQEIEVFFPVHRFLSFYLVPIRTDSEADQMPLATVILRDVTEAQRDTEKTIESHKVHALTMLAAGVAHELGNPLNSLNIHLQLMARTVEQIQDENVATEIKELLDVASHEVERLDSIVSNFLRAVRPTPPKLTRLPIQNVLADALSFMRTEIENRNILVRASWPEELPNVMADPDQLKQAFYNVIRNAVQAMPEGGVLEILCAVSDYFLEIRFADSGKGISSENMTRVMDPYFTTSPDGTGLGLLIVERIVRDHGGEMGLESREHEGTVVSIRLPLRDRRIRLLQPPDNLESTAPDEVEPDLDSTDT